MVYFPTANIFFVYIDIYQEAEDAFDDGDYALAVKNFEYVKDDFYDAKDRIQECYEILEKQELIG